MPLIKYPLFVLFAFSDHLDSDIPLFIDSSYPVPFYIPGFCGYYRLHTLFEELELRVTDEKQYATFIFLVLVYFTQYKLF